MRVTLLYWLSSVSSLRFVQGTNAEAPYAFYHWQYIDIFNYFSHHLVTIPPAVWTNAAHKHGVIVIGEQKVSIKQNQTQFSTSQMALYILNVEYTKRNGVCWQKEKWYLFLS